jgi:hypothetical protein
MTRTCICAALLLGVCAPALAQTDDPIDADRPHVGTGTHIVPRGQVQFEIGGQFQRLDGNGVWASPVLVRVGVHDRVELRLASDGVLVATGQETTDAELANVQASAKLRLWGDRHEPWLSVMPAFTFNANDPSVTLLAGTSLTDRAHVEANYGIGSISNGGARFAQHLITAAVTHATTRALTTYVEGAWWSRQQADAGAVSFVDFGGIYALSTRVLVDGGALVGLTDDTADYGLFAGISFLLGTPHHAPRTMHPAPSTSAFRAGRDRD